MTIVTRFAPPFASTPRHLTRRRRRKRIAIAATPVTPDAFCAADDRRIVRPPPRAAAGFSLREFSSWPGRELGLCFRDCARKIRTHERRPEWRGLRTL